MNYQLYKELSRLCKKENIESFLKSRDMTFSKVLAYSSNSKSLLTQARRMVFLVHFFKGKESNIGYSDWQIIVKDEFEKRYVCIAEKIEIQMQIIVNKLSDSDKKALAVLREKLEGPYSTEDLSADGIIDLPDFINNLPDILVDYTEELSVKWDELVEQTAKKNIENKAKNRPSEYSDFDFNLTPIFNYAWECKDTNEIMKYFKWLIINSKLEENFNEFYFEPLGKQDAIKHKCLREILQSKIELMEMGMPWGDKIFNRGKVFDSRGYGRPMDIKVLIDKIPVSERKMFRFIKSESEKPSPLIMKITRGKYCIRNNCESKLKESLSY